MTKKTIATYAICGALLVACGAAVGCGNKAVPEKKAKPAEFSVQEQKDLGIQVHTDDMDNDVLGHINE